MKVLLINVPIWKDTGFKSSYNPGMGLLYIGAVLRENGNEVRIIDAEAMEWWHDDIYCRAVVEWKPTHIGISCLSNGMQSAIDLIKVIKKLNPDIWISFGGVGPSCEPERALKDSGADSVCVGEGELIVDKVFSERGIHYGVSPQDLDSLPMPAYDLLEPKIGSKYWSGNLPKPPIDGEVRETVVMWSRGCPHSCIFCSKATMPRKYPRLRSPKKIIEELDMLKDKFDINSVFVYDDELIGMGEKHNDWLDEVTRNIYSFNFGGELAGTQQMWFKGQGRCSEKFVTKDVARWLKQAGFFAMMMGCESGSDEVKKAIKKGTTNDDIRHSLRILHDARIGVYGFWMVGMPTETREEARKTEKLIEEVSKFMEWIQITIFSPLPGSDFWNTAAENNYFDNYNPAFNFQSNTMLNMPWMSKEEILNWQRKLYTVYYSSKKGFD